MIKVKIVDSSSLEKELILTQNSFTLGRSEETTVRLDDKKASREHVRVEKTKQGYKLIDLDSSNGTFVNGNRIKACVLSKGDVVKIGDSFIYVLDVPEISEEAPLELKGPPEQVKNQVKKKIEQRRQLVTEEPLVKRISYVFLVLGIIGVFIAILASIFKQVIEERNRPGESQSTQTNQAEARLKIQKELDEIKAQAEIKTSMIEEYIKRCIKLQKETTDPAMDEQIQYFINNLQMKMIEYFNSQFEPIKNMAYESLKQQRYSKALDLLKNFRKEAGMKFDELIKLIIEDIDRQADSDFANLSRQAQELEKYRKFQEAKKLYELSISRFKGTDYYSQIQSHLDFIQRAQELEKKELLAKTTPKTEDPKQPAVKKETTLDKLVLVVINLAKEAKLTEFYIDEKKKGVLEAADKSGLKLNVEGTSQTVAWDKIPPIAIYKSLKSAIAGESFIIFAQYCHENQLGREADRLLYDYLKQFKDQQVQVYEIVATWRGLSQVPEGGYTFNQKLEKWEDRYDITNREALAKVLASTQQIERSSRIKDVESNFEKAFKIMTETTLLSFETQEAMKKGLVEALNNVRQKLFKDLKKHAERAARSTAGLQKQKEELDKWRKEALKRIYDEKLYPYDQATNNHGEAGQPKVDEAVNKVREIWEGKTAIPANSQLSRNFEAIEKIDNEMLAKLGEPVSADEQKELDEISLYVTKGQAITIKTYATPKDIAEYNRRVEEYNEKIFKVSILPKECDGAPETIVRQVHVLNEYREMMGRRKLFLDARLVRAAQKHSKAQEKEGRIWHEGSDGTPSSRCRDEGYSGPAGENVAMGYASPEHVHNGWYNSSGHHRGMLGAMWNCIGVGHSTAFWTQNFGVTGVPKEISTGQFDTRAKR